MQRERGTEMYNTLNNKKRFEDESSIGNAEILPNKPESNNKQIAQRVDKIAWIIEGCVISFGVAVSIGLTFPEFPNDFNFSISSMISFGLFFMLAISEASKIPLSQVFVASSSLKLKISSLIALLAVLTISTDNLITGGDVVQKQRLQPILEIKKEIEQRQNNLASIQSRIASISLEASTSTKNLVTQSEEEIAKKSKAIIELRKQINSITLSNNSSLKNSIKAEVAVLTNQIQDLKDQIEAQKQDLLLEIAELRKMKYEEMDRSLLRDRSIAKKYDQKILFKESAFDKEKRLIGRSIEKRQDELDDLYVQMRNANELSAPTKSQIKELLSKITEIQEQVADTDKARQKSITNSLSMTRAKEENKASLLQDASTTKSAVLDSKMRLDHLMRENFIYRISSYVFRKDPTDISDDEYGLINLLFIFSIAIGLSILPSFLAGISTSLRMENETKSHRSRNLEEIFKLISNVQNKRKERKSKKNDKSEKNLKDANARLREEVRQEKQKHQEALKKEAQYKNKIMKLEEEQLAKPKVVEKEVIKFIDRPYYQAVPVPISQSNSINSEFMSSLKSYFNKQNTKKTREKDEKK